MADATSNPLHHERYVRSNTYDPDWVIANQMGPSALWLLESLTEVLPIDAGSKVLDLGCGRAMTSIFLAREFGAEVTALDLWIDAEENQQRIDAAGVGGLVRPVHAEAHAMPLERESFDVVVSIDAYQYFGTDDLYIGSLVEYLRPGGVIGIVVPSVSREVGTEVPLHLQPYWEWDFCCFHTPEWWRAHWDKTGKVAVELADAVPDGWRDWQRFNHACTPSAEGWFADAASNTAALLEADQGEVLGFARVVGRKR